RVGKDTGKRVRLPMPPRQIQGKDISIFREGDFDEPISATAISAAADTAAAGVWTIRRDAAGGAGEQWSGDHLADHGDSELHSRSGIAGDFVWGAGDWQGERSALWRQRIGDCGDRSGVAEHRGLCRGW